MYFPGKYSHQRRLLLHHPSSQKVDFVIFHIGTLKIPWLLFWIIIKIQTLWNTLRVKAKALLTSLFLVAGLVVYLPEAAHEKRTKTRCA